MQVGGLRSAEIALRILTGRISEDPASGKDGAASFPPLDVTGHGRRIAPGALSAIQGLWRAGSADAMGLVQQLARTPALQGAARGEVDDTLRGLVMQGGLPTLDALDDDQWKQLSGAEKNVYGIVRTLQGLYEAQPKSLEQALQDHVKLVIESYPESIARMRAGIADGTLAANADGFRQIIADQERELAAARAGTMTIQAVDDPALVNGENQFTVHDDGVGWSGAGVRVHSDIAGLQQLTGRANVLPGSSPYTGGYVISW